MKREQQVCLAFELNHVSKLDDVHLLPSYGTFWNVRECTSVESRDCQRDPDFQLGTVNGINLQSTGRNCSLNLLKVNFGTLLDVRSKHKCIWQRPATIWRRMVFHFLSILMWQDSCHAPGPLAGGQHLQDVDCSKLLYFSTRWEFSQGETLAIMLERSTYILASGLLWFSVLSRLGSCEKFRVLIHVLGMNFPHQDVESSGNTRLSEWSSWS